MSNLKEKVAVPDVWTGKRLEKDIAEFKSSHSKEVEKLKRKVAELEYDLDSVEKAFWGGLMGLIVLDLAILAIAIF